MNKTRRESGNIFFIILIAVVLFSALAFTFSRGIQKGGESISQRRADLAASDILSYAQRVERGVQRIIGERIPEKMISFENDNFFGYANPDCTDDSCRVFKPAGGGVSWQNPPADVNNGEPYTFVKNRVGSDDGTTRQIGTDAIDLVILLPVKPAICDAINKKANGLATWESTGNLNAGALFDGDLSDAVTMQIANGDEDNQPTTGCVCDGADPCTSAVPHYFYSVILAR